MFDNQLYITTGVSENIPPHLQIFMWELIQTMPVDKDYLQVFTLSESKGKQQIIHSQEIPAYQKKYMLNVDTVFEGKVFVIDDETHSTMLLAEEY